MSQLVTTTLNSIVAVNNTVVQRKPLSLSEARKLEINGLLTVVIALSLYEIYNSGDLSNFNELVENNIADYTWIASDIEYKAVGVDADNNVLVQVDCVIEPIE